MQSLFNSTSTECEKALATFPAPPPFLNMLAKRTLSCLFFQGSCSSEDDIPPFGGGASLSKRSTGQDVDKLRTWSPFIIYMLFRCVALRSRINSINSTSDYEPAS
jgi:hypothetical protein